MKECAAVTRFCLTAAAAIVMTTLAGAAQVPGAPAVRPAGLVAGAGNFFSPIVANLDTAVAFYRDGLGLEVAGSPANADTNVPLRDMFGLPAARLRWTVARPAGARSGVEIVEIANAGGKALHRRITDPGAMTLVMSITDELDQVVARLKAHGGTVIGSAARADTPGARIAVVRDPDDHFVELIAAGAGAAPLPPRIRLTVRDVDAATALYRDALGLRAAAGPPVTAGWSMQALGVTTRSARSTVLDVPGSNLAMELVQFGERPRRVAGRIQDPGSTRLQLQVRDLDAAIRAVVRAGGRVVSSGGRPVEMPAGRGGSIRAAIVQDPDNLFLVLIAAPPGA